ncbi:hypothetical protein LSUE1_G001713 [Lachnellula suecica]|uniref:DUF7719 domain-containing protein n=1 Tax=Lachnellula suecica TaxID=602035 RepID=A0A8T9C3Z4_9HELO|nr:hypothetical protein LSUE1_G001713 [Lachnellula suecica]
MARKRKEKEVKIKLKQPDRSGPDPSQETLLQMAEQRGLLNIPQTVGKGKAESAEADEPLIGRLGESIFWTVSLTMLHFTMDVLAASQYAVKIEWDKLTVRSAQAFPIFLFLFYSLHPHPTPPAFLPRLPPRIQPILHRIFFAVLSVCTGSYLIHITNTYDYYAVMKQAPPIGCLWIWAVIELDLAWACGSLLCCIAFLKLGDYSFV